MTGPLAPPPSQGAAQRVGSALGKRSNWEQLAKFCIVGASGYLVNLAVFASLLKWAGVHYIPAAVGSFLVAVANNYTWNRVWTFRGQRGGVAYQGFRFLVVSSIALGATNSIKKVFSTVAEDSANLLSSFSESMTNTAVWILKKKGEMLSSSLGTERLHGCSPITIF